MFRSESRWFLVIAFIAGWVLQSTAAWSANTESQDFEVLVTKLLDMSGAERRAYMKGLDPQERKGLWFQVLKEIRMRRDAGLRAKMGDGAKNGQALQSGRQIPGKTPNSELRKRAVGQIQYDNGGTTTTYGGGSIIGNRFDTHTGIPVLTSGTVSTVQAVVAQGGNFTTNSAGFVLLGPQTVGGGANAVFSTFTGVTGATNTVTFSGLGVNYTGNSFFVLFGDFDNSYIPVFGTGTTKAQGYHGRIGYTGGMGPNITATGDLGGNQNALIRATGNIVPVELMKFNVE